MATAQGISRHAFATCVSRAGFRHSSLQAALILLLAAAGAGTVQAQPASSASSAQALREYSIPQGPLSQVLSRFAGESGVTLSADSALMGDAQSPGLHGRFAVISGFSQLLRGTGLEAVQTNPAIFVLRKS
ncbi:MAG: STN domain-containing protein, partial [Comamonas sp.]